MGGLIQRMNNHGHIYFSSFLIFVPIFQQLNVQGHTTYSKHEAPSFALSSYLIVIYFLVLHEFVYIRVRYRCNMKPLCQVWHQRSRMHTHQKAHLARTPPEFSELVIVGELGFAPVPPSATSAWHITLPHPWWCMKNAYAFTLQVIAALDYIRTQNCGLLTNCGLF